MTEIKSGYIKQDEIQDSKMNNAVSIQEQDTAISFMRDEDFAIEYTSDSTEMTIMNKLCKNSPAHYQLIADTGRGKTYKITPKSLISHRSKVREMSDDAKQAASYRFKQMWADKRS